MKKYIVTAALVMTLVLVHAPTVTADREVSVKINGVYVEFPDQQPIIVDSRTLVPVRGVFEQLGFGVYWEIESPQTATLINDYYTVHITIGSEVFTVNGRSYTLDVPAQLIGARTMLPIRAVLEAVGLVVDWDNATWTVLISGYVTGPAYITIQGERFSTALTELRLESLDLTNEDIAPLRYMTNLTRLSLVDNAITDVSPLSELGRLTRLNISLNQVTDISPLGNLTNLTELDLWGNQFVDISSLNNLTNLTSFIMFDNVNFNGDISVVKNFSNLTFLKLGSRWISDFTPIGGLVNLEYLYLHEVTQFSDLSIVEDLTSLTLLSIEHSRIRDFSPIRNLQKLTTLEIISPQTKIDDISYLFLDSLPNLTDLSLTRSHISDISALRSLTNLTRLNLFHNQISDICPLSELTNLTRLTLSVNQISDINALSGLTNLTHLWLFRNQISNIAPLTNLTNLTWLDLENNPITDWSPVAHVRVVHGRPR